MKSYVTAWIDGAFRAVEEGSPEHQQSLRVPELERRVQELERKVDQLTRQLNWNQNW